MNQLPLNEDDKLIIQKMISTLIRFRKREAANNRDVYYLGEAIKSLSDLHEIKGWGEIK